MASLKVAFVCQAVDAEDPLLASTIQWIEAMNDRVEALSLLVLRTGNHPLSAKIPIFRFGSRYKPMTAVRLLLASLRLFWQGRLNCFFVYQGGPYPLVLFPFRLFGIRIFQWKAHPARSWVNFLCAYVCCNHVFTSVPSAYPYRAAKVRVVGQGIDVDRFRPLDGRKSGVLVSVTRYSPVKNIETMIKAVAVARRRWRLDWTLDIYGVALDGKYKDRLLRLTLDLNLSEFVRLNPSVRHAELPGVLSRYRIFLNCSRTALDRAVAEAMSCGLPVVSCNPCFAEILPDDLAGDLVSMDDSDALAECIRSLLEKGEQRVREVGQEMRRIVCQEHSLRGLMIRIVALMEGY